MSDEKRDNRLDAERQSDPGRFSPVPKPKMPPSPPSSVGSAAHNPIFPIASYCMSSILMTVTNKYVLSSTGTFNLNFFLLAVQSFVCIAAIQTCKSLGFISYRDFKTDEAKKWFPISVLLVSMIYTGSKAIQYLSIPVYTIFKNLTTILIAYGEVLWFGGSVTPLSLFSFGLMVLSSVIAAWADVQAALSRYGGTDSTEASNQIATLNAGYVWMLVNCLCTAAYLLGMRKRIKVTNFKDFDTMFYNNLLSIPILLVSTILAENWSAENINLNFPLDARTGIIAAMIISGLSSIFISYTSAWCVRTTSSTTYSMVGALNKLPIAISGLIFFDAPITVPSVSAIGVGFLAGIVYTISKSLQSKAQSSATEKGGLPRPVTTSASSQSMRDSLKA